MGTLIQLHDGTLTLPLDPGDLRRYRVDLDATVRVHRTLEVDARDETDAVAKATELLPEADVGGGLIRVDDARAEEL